MLNRLAPNYVSPWLPGQAVKTDLLMNFPTPELLYHDQVTRLPVPGISLYGCSSEDPNSNISNVSAPDGKHYYACRDNSDTAGSTGFRISLADLDTLNSTSGWTIEFMMRIIRDNNFNHTMMRAYEDASSGITGVISTRTSWYDHDLQLFSEPAHTYTHYTDYHTTLGTGWQHWAVVRSGNTIGLFIDGVRVQYRGIASAITADPHPDAFLDICYSSNDTRYDPIYNALTWLRLSNVARYIGTTCIVPPLRLTELD